MPPLRHILIQEGTTKTITGIGAPEVDLPPSGTFEQLVNALQRCKIGLERLGRDIERAETAAEPMKGGNLATRTVA